VSFVLCIVDDFYFSTINFLKLLLKLHVNIDYIFYFILYSISMVLRAYVFPQSVRSRVYLDVSVRAVGSNCLKYIDRPIKLI